MQQSAEHVVDSVFNDTHCIKLGAPIIHQTLRIWIPATTRHLKVDEIKHSEMKPICQDIIEIVGR